MFWKLVQYGWFLFMAASVCSVIGAAIWDSRAPKRRLKKLEKERLRQEQEAAKAAEAEAVAAETPPDAAVEAPVESTDSVESPPAEQAS